MQVAYKQHARKKVCVFAESTVYLHQRLTISGLEEHSPTQGAPQLWRGRQRLRKRSYTDAGSDGQRVQANRDTPPDCTFHHPENVTTGHLTAEGQRFAEIVAM